MNQIELSKNVFLGAIFVIFLSFSSFGQESEKFNESIIRQEVLDSVYAFVHRDTINRIRSYLLQKNGNRGREPTIYNHPLYFDVPQNTFKIDRDTSFRKLHSFYEEEIYRQFFLDQNGDTLAIFTLKKVYGAGSASSDFSPYKQQFELWLQQYVKSDELVELMKIPNAPFKYFCYRALVNKRYPHRSKILNAQKKEDEILMGSGAHSLQPNLTLYDWMKY